MVKTIMDPGVIILGVIVGIPVIILVLKLFALFYLMFHYHFKLTPAQRKKHKAAWNKAKMNYYKKHRNDSLWF